MNRKESTVPSDEQYANGLDFSQYDTQGFQTEFPLLIHKFEAEADSGSHEARRDWIKYIRPTIQFGGCNPVNGNFTSLTMPFCLPERLRHMRTPTNVSSDDLSDCHHSINDEAKFCFRRFSR
jgi:hypothetical protein